MGGGRATGRARGTGGWGGPRDQADPFCSIGILSAFGLTVEAVH